MQAAFRNNQKQKMPLTVFKVLPARIMSLFIILHACCKNDQPCKLKCWASRDSKSGYVTEPDLTIWSCPFCSLPLFGCPFVAFTRGWTSCHQFLDSNPRLNPVNFRLWTFNWITDIHQNLKDSAEDKKLLLNWHKLQKQQPINQRHHHGRNRPLLRLPNLVL